MYCDNCGAKVEDDAAFCETLKLIENIQPSIVNISKFFVRPNTRAERLEQKVDPKKIQERSRKLTAFCKKISFNINKKWLNWRGPILIDEIGKYPNSWIGRNFAYKPVVVKSNDNLFGKFLQVQIVEVFRTYLKAKLV